MGDKIATAIIGTGFIGPVHVEALRRNADLVEVKAVAGISRQEAARVAEQLSIPCSTGDYRDLLERSDIDAVHICTPNFLHYPMVKAALEHGKHVLCEKPLALTSQEAQELTNLAKQKNLAAGVNYNLRYYPMVHEMKALVSEGSLGRLFSVNGVYLQDWLLYETDYSWRLESSQSGSSRAVADIGTHWMDMAQFITGRRITEVCASFARMYDTRKQNLNTDETTFSGSSNTSSASYRDYAVDTEDYASILFKFDHGAVGSLTVSQVSAGHKNKLDIEVNGTESAIRWGSEEPNQLWQGYRNQSNRIIQKDPAMLHPEAAAKSGFPGGHQEGYGETFKYLFRDFYSGLISRLSGGSPGPLAVPSFLDGTNEMLLCEAIIKSASENRWVTVIPNS